MGVHSIDAEDDQFAYRYDTQLLIDRRDRDLDEDEIADYITENFEGNSLIAAGDEDLVKIHFHTNEPWKILEYCNTVGEIYDIVVEDMIRPGNWALAIHRHRRHRCKWGLIWTGNRLLPVVHPYWL